MFPAVVGMGHVPSYRDLGFWPGASGFEIMLRIHRCLFVSIVISKVESQHIMIDSSSAVCARMTADRCSIDNIAVWTQGKSTCQLIEKEWLWVSFGCTYVDAGWSGFVSVCRKDSRLSFDRTICNDEAERLEELELNTTERAYSPDEARSPSIAVNFPSHMSQGDHSQIFVAILQMPVMTLVALTRTHAMNFDFCCSLEWTTDCCELKIVRSTTESLVLSKEFRFAFRHCNTPKSGHDRRSGARYKSNQGDDLFRESIYAARGCKQFDSSGCRLHHSRRNTSDGVWIVASCDLIGTELENSDKGFYGSGDASCEQLYGG